jgi:hypothetical protein
MSQSCLNLVFASRLCTRTNATGRGVLDVGTIGGNLRRDLARIRVLWCAVRYKIRGSCSHLLCSHSTPVQINRLSEISSLARVAYCLAEQHQPTRHPDYRPRAPTHKATSRCAYTSTMRSSQTAYCSLTSTPSHNRAAEPCDCWRTGTAAGPETTQPSSAYRTPFAPRRLNPGPCSRISCSEAGTVL